MPAKHLRITGLVQGVFFRDGTKRIAEELGIMGWVKNTDDGAVEAHIEGSAEALEKMIAWCRQGPPKAKVNDVTVEDAPEKPHEGFEIWW